MAHTVVTNANGATRHPVTGYRFTQRSIVPFSKKLPHVCGRDQALIVTESTNGTESREYEVESLNRNQSARAKRGGVSSKSPDYLVLY
ncbi:hypothetical protein KQX54_020592 [Cotesia glomerata]|uniref:Uncharacterized protein n=1 Tax=Cotesia glomerata TaxID=32391 RepID=A0AAV7I4U6_COTGL|nr:hypothetical protein KQX54_020592 [Cotesia glomerata]